ncbi:MAG: hypothetical protein IID31_03070 [Planctomycetes bacterium]|nr:hypothetical protein [Planctomycetota bacterium]
MSEQTAKVCVWCKQDCSHKPRRKDSKGRYLCQECVEPFQQAKAARAARAISVPESIPLAPEPDGGDVLNRLVEQQSANAGQPCPSCSRAMARDAVICTHCGYNMQTGRQMQSHVQVLEPERGESKTVKAAVAVADSAPVSLLMGTVGCLIGSAVGAAAWAAVAYYLNFEVAYLAIGVGVLAGGGMMIGARGHAGASTGAIAALAAIVAILIGKYIVVSYVIDEYVRDADIAVVTDQDVTVNLADRIVYRRQEQGEVLNWPEDMTVDDAYEPEDYPAGIWEEAERQWAEMDQSERDRVYREIRANLQEAIALAKEESFLDMFSLFDVIFIGLALFVAFGIGSGGSFD